ncbi:MAG: hypothetical protein DRG82_12440 [Deltaproteobacteria bacterium]|nr:MAG: hypothetical protein DRG82_12440 [Deltaproteobacteria bacterium]
MSSEEKKEEKPQEAEEEAKDQKESAEAGSGKEEQSKTESSVPKETGDTGQVEQEVVLDEAESVDEELPEPDAADSEAAGNQDGDTEKEVTESSGETPPEEGKTQENTDESKEEIGDAWPVEEEVILDEAAPLDEEPPEPDAADSEAAGTEDGDTEKEVTESSEQASKKGDGTGGVFAFLRKKWVLFSAGTVFFALGISFLLLAGNRGEFLTVDSLLGGNGKDEQSVVQSVLDPFFIPLPENSENAAVKLVISVKWDPEILTRYKKRPVAVRNQVYRYLLQAAGSGKDMVKEKSALASELSQVFQHVLAVRNVKVRVDEVSLT